MSARTTHRAAARPAGSQQGAALILIVIALFVLMLMAGLALDVGHMVLNKARLQNAVDAAALSAAKTLDQTSNTTLATAAAYQALSLNASSAGDQELATSYNGGSLQVTVQYSSTLPPFTPGSTNGPYVRVIATGFTFPAWFAEIAAIRRLGVTASAVAGPSPTIGDACNLVPILACGTPPSQSPPPPNYLWGYTPGELQVLKSAAPGSTQMGPGNFQLLQLGGSGADLVRQNLAGGYQPCQVSGSSVPTETGNEAGPVSQGINTRFGIYSGLMTSANSPPDAVTDYSEPMLTVDSNGNIAGNISAVFDYAAYQNAIEAGDYNNPPVPEGDGVLDRRLLTVPVGNCAASGSGSTTVPILGFACFFLVQPVTQQGTSDYIIGQFENDCQINGTSGPVPDSGPGPYLIELYHDPASPDS